MKGAAVCHYHGGKSPQAQEAAQRRRALVEVERELAKFQRRRERWESIVRGLAVDRIGPAGATADIGGVVAALRLAGVDPPPQPRPFQARTIPGGLDRPTR